MRLLFAIPFVVLAILAPAAHAVTYTFTEVRPPGDPAPTGVYVSGINDAGQVLGVDSLYNAFVFDSRTGQYSATIGFTGINNRGQTLSPAGINAASVYDPATNQTSVFQLSIQNGTVDLRGLNSAGQIIGTNTYGPNGFYTEEGVLFDPATGRTNRVIDPAGITIYPSRSELAAINDRGQIVGTSYTVYKGYSGFLYDQTSDTYTTIRYPGAKDTYLSGLNNVGQVVGYYDQGIGLSVSSFVLDLASGT